MSIISFDLSACYH